MKASLSAALVLLATLHSQPQQRFTELHGTSFQAVVVAVTDGDTFDVEEAAAGRRLTIRLHGVDSPERGEPFADKARTFMRVMLFSQTVLVAGREVDRYGRLVARIQVSNKDASVELLRAGLGCHYRAYSNDPTLEDAEAQARSRELGFWARGAPQPRCVAREASYIARGRNAAAPTPETVHFVGNVNSRVYHSPSCRNATCKNCTVRFESAAEAEAAGYRPAGDCLRR